MDSADPHSTGLYATVCAGDGDLLEWILQEGNYTTLVLDVWDYGRDALPLLEKCQVIYTPIREDPFSAEKMREFEEYLETVGNGAVMEKIQKIHVPMVTGGRRMEHFPQELLWGDMGDFVRSLLKGQRNLWDS